MIKMIVGFLGSLCSGKTTAANHAAEKFGGKVYSLAHPIKMMVKEFSFPYDRNTLVKLGETLKHYFGNNLFVDILFKNAASNIQKSVPIFIDDVRFQYEANFIEEMGGTVFYIEVDYKILHQRYLARNRDIDEKMSYTDFVNYLYTCPAEIFSYLQYGKSKFSVIKNNKSLDHFFSQIEDSLINVDSNKFFMDFR
ncbi:MAG: hypothetical protein ACE5ES_00120 [Candidatus Nanoarchaeia archaeon]